LGLQTGPNPTDRAKPGSKRHVICDGRGIPLVVQLTGANRNDSQHAIALVDAIPALPGNRGRPRHRPDCVLGDRGYDAEAIRRGLRARNIVAFLEKRNTETWQWAGAMAWAVERTFAWLNQFRRLRVRYEKRADIHEAFLALGCILLEVSGRTESRSPLMEFRKSLPNGIHRFANRAATSRASTRCQI
jgi:transposase